MSEDLVQSFMEKQYHSEALLDEANEIREKLEKQILNLINIPDTKIWISLSSNYIISIEIYPMDKTLEKGLQEQLNDLFSGEPITNDPSYHSLVLEYDIQE